MWVKLEVIAANHGCLYLLFRTRTVITNFYEFVLKYIYKSRSPLFCCNCRLPLCINME